MTKDSARMQLPITILIYVTCNNENRTRLVNQWAFEDRIIAMLDFDSIHFDLVLLYIHLKISDRDLSLSAVLLLLPAIRLLKVLNLSGGSGFLCVSLVFLAVVLLSLVL